MVLKKGDVVYSKDNPNVFYEVLGTSYSVVEVDPKAKVKSCLKDRMIEHIKQVNSNSDISEHITKLYYEDEDAELQCVTDYSTFLDYMSEELQESFKYGRTLSKKLEDELNHYRIERFYKPEDKQPNVEKLITISNSEVILSQQATEKLLKVMEELKGRNIL